MKTVPELYLQISSALTDLANAHGVRLDTIQVKWLDTSCIDGREYQCQELEIREGAMYYVEKVKE